jgi:hypothetical protein
MRSNATWVARVEYAVAIDRAMTPRMRSADGPSSRETVVVLLGAVGSFDSAADVDFPLRTQPVERALVFACAAKGTEIAPPAPDAGSTQPTEPQT